MPLPILDGEGVRLRSMVEADAPDVLALFGDPQMSVMVNIRQLMDEADARAFIGRLRTHADNETLCQWGITQRDEDRVIGTVTLASIDTTHRRAELGYALAPASRGRGLATRAVRLVVDHAFGVMALHRLEADVDPQNPRSIAVLERLGFVREGYRRERWLLGGRWQDTIDYGLLASSWGSSPR